MLLLTRRRRRRRRRRHRVETRLSVMIFLPLIALATFIQICVVSYKITSLFYCISAMFLCFLLFI